MTSWHEPAPIDWQNPDTLEANAIAFCKAVADERYDSWILSWCAGTSVMSSSTKVMQEETDVFALVLQCITMAMESQNIVRPGLVFLASSAGAVYTTDEMHTEDSTPTPVSEYGKQKLQQEELLRAWCDQQPSTRFLIGRLSNLYGPRQNLSKPQGLLSHISRCMLYRQPVHIYVPLDTARDFLYVEDCAADIARCLSTMLTHPQLMGKSMVKIFAAEEGTTVAQILGTFARVTKQQPRVVCSATATSGLYQRNVRLRSVVMPNANRQSTPLLIGIDRLHAYQQAIYRKGKLHRPATSLS